MGSRFRTPPSHQARARKRISTVLTAALLAASLSALAPATAHADTSPAPAPTTSAPPSASADAVALTTAEATGSSVPVTADTTDESTTVANPNGSYTYTATTTPTQVQQNGSWVPVDAALHQTTAGTWIPNAAASSVAFSNGGTNPLVTLTSSAGQSLSLSWPSALPEPTVSGATATYANVLPGVNLAMTATASGGYTEQLIVTSATAAANPALANIQFNTSTTGLTLSSTAAGGLQAVDASGTTVFAAPTATMWSTPAAQDPTATGSSQHSAAAASDSADDTGAGQGGDSPTTDVGLQVSGGTLDLQPPAAALTGSNVTYPVVIDPAVTPAIMDNDWTWVSETNSGTSYWQGSNDDYKDGSDAKVGYDDWCASSDYTTGGCPQDGFGRTRALFSLDMNGLAGKHVTNASFLVYEQGTTSSWSTSPSYDMKGAGAFDQNTTWANQPTPSTSYVTSTTLPTVNSTTVSNGSFDTTALIQNAVASGYHTQTIELQAANEYDDTAYRYLVTSGKQIPALTVTYYSTPDVPSNLAITNGTQSYPCHSSGGIDTAAPGYWINGSDSKTVTLDATVSSPDVGDESAPITSQFWEQEIKPSTAAQWHDQGGQTVNSVVGGTATQSPPMTLAGGDQFHWQVYDGEDDNAFSSTAAPSTTDSCWFSVDTTAPSLGTEVATLPTTVDGTPGTLTLSATDGGPLPSGVASISYNVNGTSLTAGGDNEHTVPTAGGDSGSITIPLVAEHWGTNSVWWSATDVAGNVATAKLYTFYVSPGTYTPGTAGDLSGDGKPDLATIDSSGNIDLDSNPLADTPTSADASSVLIPAAKASSVTGAASFTGALIAHSGSTHGLNCDDLAIVQNGNLAIEQNNNCLITDPNNTWTPNNEVRPSTPATGTPATAAAAYDSTDWYDVQQLLALSTPETTKGNTDLVTTDLITLESAGGTQYLWEFPLQGASPTAPTLLASGGAWSGISLINAGLVNGQHALWVRNNTSGVVTQYLDIDADTTNTLTGTQIANSGYSTATYPLLVSAGDITDSNGATGPALWATDTAGTLQLIPTTLDSSGNATILGPEPMTATGWATGLTAIS